MPLKMECLIFVAVIGFLENGHIVCAAFMKIGILIGIHRIDFQANHFEIFAGNLQSLSDVCDGGFGAAFTGQNQNFL